jgi:invasion protein IalB
MKQRTAVAILVAAILAVGAIGAFIFLRPEPQPQQPVSQIPQLPPGTQSFGNWALVCNGQPGAQDGPDRCGLLMRVINQEAQRVMMSLNVTRGPQGNAIIVVNTPPGVIIPAGVSITPENGTQATGGVQVCRPNGCTGVVLLTEELKAELDGSQQAAIGYVAANGQPVNLNLPINGFVQGYAAWEAAFPAPPPAEGEGEDGAAAEGEAE